MAELSSTASSRKVCVKCRKDVTNEKRMKGSKGEYWCYDCGVADQMSKGGGLLTPCADCGKPLPPTSLYRRDGDYVCSSCSKKAPKTGLFSGGGGGDPADRSQRIKLVVAVVIFAIAVPMLLLSFFHVI